MPWIIENRIRRTLNFQLIPNLEKQQGKIEGTVG